jgi:hypothetical protein
MINVSEILFNEVKDKIDEESIIDFDIKLLSDNTFKPKYLMTFHFLDGSKKEVSYIFSAEMTQELRDQDVEGVSEFIDYYTRISNLNKLTHGL